MWFTLPHPQPPPAPPEFDAVYRAHAAAVWRALSGLGVRGADVHDACQEVFVVVHRRLHEFDGRHKVGTWIHAICVNVARAWRRRAAKREPLTDDDSSLVSDDDPERAASARQSAEALRRLLDALDDDRRAVFVLSDYVGMSAPEIAASLGVNVNTVYTRLRAARADFEAALARHQRRSR